MVLYMLKRDTADRLYSIVIKRIRKEQPERELTNAEMSAIWDLIYKKLNSGYSETAIEQCCKNIAF